MNITSKEVWTKGYTVGHIDILQLPRQDFFLSVVGEVARMEGRYKGRGRLKPGANQGRNLSPGKRCATSGHLAG